MEYRHLPVLLTETLEHLKVRPDGTYVDGTVGGAGHWAAIFEKLSKGGRLLGIDLDKTALKEADKRLGELDTGAEYTLAHGNFADMDLICRKSGITGADGILLDIGVSSYQLDNPERGFSYNHDARLDMRMDASAVKDACTVVNSYDRKELTRVIARYGEEKWASRIAKFIVKEREKGRIETTGKLVEVIKAAVPASARRKGPHPAKRTFQALRIEVNGELENLEKALDKAVKILNPGGRICVITFHSLEDRLVKNKFRVLSRKCECPPGTKECFCGKKAVIKCITKKPVAANEAEKAGNPRSRSAKLRVAEKDIIIICK